MLAGIIYPYTRKSGSEIISYIAIFLQSVFSYFKVIAKHGVAQGAGGILGWLQILKCIATLLPFLRSHPLFCGQHLKHHTVIFFQHLQLTLLVQKFNFLILGCTKMLYVLKKHAGKII